jgi:putative redox protein
MAAKGSAPALLVGHSLGGAAALAAAGEIASVKAVATIGAPGDPAHALRLLGDGLATIEATGQAQVSIGGRPFMISRAFVEDARMQDLPGRITRLGRALLVLHSPVDAIVGIENASEIFLAARHPKSFVSLDTASHLLSDNRDADYAASVIAVWAGRYLGAAAERSAEAPPGVALVEETGAGKFQVQVSVGGTHFFADEPQDVGGLGSGPTPHELVSAGLGACTAMTLRMYADRKGWPLKRTRVAVSHERVAGQTPANVFTRRIAVEGPLDATQTARLFEIAARCPVHRALEEGSRVVTGPFVAADAPAPASDAEEHFREMEDACRTADAAGSP